MRALTYVSCSEVLGEEKGSTQVVLISRSCPDQCTFNGPEMPTSRSHCGISTTRRWLNVYATVVSAMPCSVRNRLISGVTLLITVRQALAPCAQPSWIFGIKFPFRKIHFMLAITRLPILSSEFREIAPQVELGRSPVLV